MTSAFSEFNNTVSKIITTKNTIYAFGRISNYGPDEFCPMCLPTETAAEEGGGAECVCETKQPEPIQEAPRPKAVPEKKVVKKAAAREVEDGWETLAEEDAGSSEEVVDETSSDEDDDDGDDDEGEDGKEGTPRSQGKGKKVSGVKPFSKIKSFKKIARTIVQTNSVIQTVEKTASRSKVIVASKSKELSKVTIIGGTPITPEIAIELRQRIFGGAQLIGSSLGEWLGVPFCFQGVQKQQGMSCLLKSKKLATKGFLMCVQGYILKHILFNKSVKVKDKQRLLLTTTATPDSLKCKLSVAARAQEESLAVALTDFLWKAGERKTATLCLCGSSFNVCSSENYQSDGCTERIQLFQFRKQEDLYCCIKRYLYEFVCEEGNGLLLALYSLVLSRGFKSLDEDLEGDKDLNLVQVTGGIHPCVANLMIAGRATKHMHNGIIFEGTVNKVAKMRTGILARCEIGLLVGPAADGTETEVGSRLKTPCLPLWITRSNGNSYGILFSPNRELIRNYHAEKTFDIYYYSSSGTTPTMLTVDTREKPQVKEDNSVPALENALRTKWHDANVDWHGTTPYF